MLATRVVVDTHDTVEQDVHVTLELGIVVVVGDEDGLDVGSGVQSDRTVVGILLAEDLHESGHQIHLGVFLGEGVDYFGGAGLVEEDAVQREQHVGEGLLEAVQLDDGGDVGTDHCLEVGLELSALGEEVGLGECAKGAENAVAEAHLVLLLDGRVEGDFAAGLFVVEGLGEGDDLVGVLLHGIVLMRSREQFL